MKWIVVMVMLSCNLMAQSHDYMGFLFLENIRPISYRMIFDDNKGQINGFSITGIGTDFETKSEISGYYSKKSIEIKEFQIISTISEEPISSFCFVEFKAQRKNKKTFHGDFTGYYLNGEVCASGKVLFSEKAKLEKQLKRVQKVQEIITKRSENQLTFLQSGDEHTINWESKKFKMQLWDSSIEDGDRMTVIINGEKVLSNATMFSKKKTISYLLRHGENVVEIIAENEGEKANNTTRIELIDKKTKHAVLSELQVGKKITIKVNYSD
ncbi:MAG: hypothetical protein VXY06_00835 [Bacteroidota bacterium]|nr:hypothetical protein [Bacteroidota bacterium]